MKLILEIINENSLNQKDFQFDRISGTIGRTLESDWQLDDETNQISAKHMMIEFKDNIYFVKDISSNGIYLKEPYRKLPKEMPIKINSMDIFIIGSYEIQARFIENKIMYKNMSDYNYLLNNEKGISSSIIPDDDFLLEDSKIMNNTFVKKESTENFQSIVKLYEDKDSKLIDDINSEVTVIDDDLHNEINSRDSLHQHMNISKFSNLFPEEEIICEVNETKKSYVPSNIPDDNLLIHLENKLGITLRGLSVLDKEKILIEIADIVLETLEGLKISLTVKDKILDDLNIDNFNLSTINLNPIRKGKEVLGTIASSAKDTITISEAVKKSFNEINNHTVAFHRANKNLIRKTFEGFSPKLLEKEFEKKDFTLFKPKKIQMWNAYVHMYQELLKQDNFMLDSVQKDFSNEYNNTIFKLKSTSI
jgi:type VI secretion system FHA domain protein